MNRLDRIEEEWVSKDVDWLCKRLRECERFLDQYKSGGCALTKDIRNLLKSIREEQDGE